MNKIVKAGCGIIGASAGFIACTAAAYMPFVIADANRKFDADCDYLMILGGNIIGADTPSPQLFERMKSAAVYLSGHPEVKAVPCGGCFRDGQKKSEARVIADYLIENGVDESRIILENKSTTTFENFEFAIKIIENDSGKNINDLRVAFLSSSYHMHRSAVIAKAEGIENVLRVSAPTPGSAFQRYVREYFVGYDLLIRTIGKRLGK